MDKEEKKTKIATLEEIKLITLKRFDMIELILDELSEEELNGQPLDNKRTIAEMIDHLLYYQRLHPVINKIMYFFLNIFQNSINEAIIHSVTADDYIWDLSTGNTRNPKLITKDVLVGKTANALDVENKRFSNYKEKHRSLLHTKNHHLSKHLMQIRELLIHMDNKLSIEIDLNID